MAPLIRVLARAVPDLTFTLATLCIDDSSIASYQFEAGRQRQWTVPERVREAHWDRARRKFKLAGDDVYLDDEAELWAEDAIMTEALRRLDDERLLARSWTPGTRPIGRSGNLRARAAVHGPRLRSDKTRRWILDGPHQQMATGYLHRAGRPARTPASTVALLARARHAGASAIAV